MSYNDVNLSDLAEKATEISQTIPYESANSFEKDHTVVEGIAAKKQIITQPNYEIIGETATAGSCDIAVAGAISPTEKYWDPGDTEQRFELCSRDLYDSLSVYHDRAKRLNPDFFNSLSPVEQLATAFFMSIKNSIDYSLSTKYWFSDVNADNISGTGLLTDGTNIKWFNTFTGIFQEAFTAISATTLANVTISQNALLTKATQLALDADTAYNTFVAMMSQADSRIFNTNPIFYVTRTLYDNYINYLETNKMSNGLVEYKEGKIESVFFRGVQVKVEPSWDRVINAYYNNGTTLYNPHRAVLTDRDNIPYGVLSKKDLYHLNSFYDNDDRKVKTDWGTRIDSSLSQEYLAVTAGLDTADYPA